MSLLSLSILNLRNISSAQLNCSPYFNLFFGDNAAGKTSLLEAIYYLGSAKSFRVNNQDRLIRHNENEMTVFSHLFLNNKQIKIGLQRSREGALSIRINEETIRSASEISRYLPVQFIASDSHRILSDGPKCRRQFLDWGLFHTNPLFYNHWKNFLKVLSHRNAALKARAPYDELLIWNAQFAESGEQFDQQRRAYLSDFIPVFNEIIAVLLGDVSVSLVYSSGWDANSSLETCLNQNVSRETFVGHSLFGPQRADLIVMSNNMPAEEVLSQGQQKLVSYALRLAQGVHFKARTGKTPVYLIDDLPSELDSHKRLLVGKILADLSAQVFITGIEPADLDEMLAGNPENLMFHVKQGEVVNVSRETFCY